MNDTALNELAAAWDPARQINRSDDPEEMEARDETFHLALAEGGGNLILRNYLADVNRHLRIVRRLGFTRSERIGQSRRRQARSNCASRARVFYATPLQEILQQLGGCPLAVYRVTTEVCVQTTMREANDRGYACLLVEDGTESYFPEFKQAVLDMITAQGGIVGWTATCDAVCAGLERAYG